MTGSAVRLAVRPRSIRMAMITVFRVVLELIRVLVSLILL